MSKVTILPLEKASNSSCGAKAAACAQLATVAAEAGFRTPVGVCLPFGSMEAAIQVHGPHGWHVSEVPCLPCAFLCSAAAAAVQEAGKGAEYEALLGEVEGARLEGGALEAACTQLQALVAAAMPPASIMKQACEWLLLSAMCASCSAACVLSIRAC